MPVVNRIAAMQDEVTAWRQDLHEHPELGFDVHRTAGIVAEKLEAFGCDEVIPGVGKTTLACTAARESERIALTLRAMSSVARAVSFASSFTSLATTAKPLPASPARAASIVALSARRLVWEAMSEIRLTTSPIFCDASAAFSRKLD